MDRIPEYGLLTGADGRTYLVRITPDGPVHRVGAGSEGFDTEQEALSFAAWNIRGYMGARRFEAHDLWR